MAELDAMVAADAPAETPRRPPAFQLYARDWLEMTAHLTPVEQAVVFRLLCHQWVRGPLPDDRERLGRMLMMSETDLEALWPVVEEFLPVNGDGRRASEWMETQRRALDAYHRDQRRRSLLGVEARRRKAAERRTNDE